MRTFTRDDIINCFKELDKRLPPKKHGHER